MAGMCCGVAGESEATAAIEPSSSMALKRRKMDQLMTACKLIADVAVSPSECPATKRQRIELRGIKSGQSRGLKKLSRGGFRVANGLDSENRKESVPSETARFGVTSVCGRRRDMEDAVSVHPRSSREGFQFFGVFDGHGCSHVATKCKDRLYEIVKEEVESSPPSSEVKWEEAMERSFTRVDAEVKQRGAAAVPSTSCRCELQAPQCDAVGSTAVVSLVTPEKIVVSNCGDSRAVLCRDGVAIPLSSDHKPDRPDELARIEAAGGRVIYWDGARVLGMLAMSRAIGDNYLKPYVISDPEVTVTDRSDGDECLILASDGLWDVVSNETACGVARMCLRARNPKAASSASPAADENGGGGGAAAVWSSDKACADASILLTKLALARRTTDNVSVVVVDLRRQ